MLSVTPFIVTIAALSASFASTVPANPVKINLLQLTGEKEMKDGIYNLMYDDNNTPSVNYTAFASDTVQRDTASVDRSADLPGVTRREKELTPRAAGCDNITLNGANLQKANQGLQDKCGGGLYGTTWVVAGSVVSFYCQNDEKAKCNSRNALEAVQWIIEKCGVNGAGSYTGSGYSYGYTDHTLHDFCNMVIS